MRAWALLLLIAVPSVSFAAPPVPPSPPGDSFEYPELLVTPRASERLEMEAKEEHAHRFTTQLPLQIPALMTFVAGLAQSSYTDPSKDIDGTSHWAGLAVGGGWLITTTILALSAEPYSSGWQDVLALPKGSRREQLMRERMAEEALARPARLASRLKWLSVLTHAGAAAYMVAKSQNDSFGRLLDGAALLVAFTPLIFKHSWQDVYSQQESYKKRIYGPVATAAPTVAQIGGKLAPMLALNVSF